MNALAYQRAIDLLVSGNVDYKAIVVTLAKTDPSLFVQLAEQVTPQFTSDKRANLSLIMRAMADNNKIAAIKTIRETYGIGLKEAKDVADNLQNYMAKCGNTLMGSYGSASHLANPIQAHLDEIIQFYNATC